LGKEKLSLGNGGIYFSAVWCYAWRDISQRTAKLAIVAGAFLIIVSLAIVNWKKRES